jgi:molybdopterin synthase sulfur carrier subunit
MSVRVVIPTALRRHTSGAKEIVCPPGNLPQVVGLIGQQFPELAHHICDEQGNLRRFLNVYVNDEDIRFLGGNSYRLQDGDELLLIPSIAGG